MADYQNNQNMCLDWNDAIENDGQNFITLEEGDYNFTVTNFERGRHAGSEKIPPCNKAILTLRVDTDKGVAIIHTDLILYKSMEWKISAFFRCIGQKKQGERLVMDWNSVINSRGRAHFKPKTYIGRDGTERQGNELDRYYDWDEQYFPVQNELVEVTDDDDELPFL